MILLGGVLACIALVGAFFAGSDEARIHGSHRLLMSAAGSLMLAALILEYHA